AYGHMFTAFEKEARENPDLVQQGYARRAAHDAWFDDPRKLYIHIYDHTVMQVYSVMLSAARGMMGFGAAPAVTKRLPAKALEALAEGPDGINHLKLQLKPKAGDAMYGKLRGNEE